MRRVEWIAVVVGAVFEQELHEFSRRLGQRVDRVTPSFHGTKCGQQAGWGIEADSTTDL